MYRKAHVTTLIQLLIANSKSRQESLGMKTFYFQRSFLKKWLPFYPFGTICHQNISEHVNKIETPALRIGRFIVDQTDNPVLKWFAIVSLPGFRYGSYCRSSQGLLLVDRAIQNTVIHHQLKFGISLLSS